MSCWEVVDDDEEVMDDGPWQRPSWWLSLEDVWRAEYPATESWQPTEHLPIDGWRYRLSLVLVTLAEYPAGVTTREMARRLGFSYEEAGGHLTFLLRLSQHDQSPAAPTVTRTRDRAGYRWKLKPPVQEAAP